MVIAEGHLITLIRTTGLVQSYHWLLIGWNWCETIGMISRTAKFFLQLTEASALYLQVASVQSSSVTQSCPVLCDPMDCSTPGFPVHHQLPEFVQTHVHWVSEAIHPSQVLTNHLTQFLYGEGALLAGGLLCCLCASAYCLCRVLLVVSNLKGHGFHNNPMISPEQHDQDHRI